MPRFDDVIARALAEIRYMPLAYYLDHGDAAADGQKTKAPDLWSEEGPGLVPTDAWDRLDWLLTCTAIANDSDKAA